MMGPREVQEAAWHCLSPRASCSTCSWLQLPQGTASCLFVSLLPCLWSIHCQFWSTRLPLVSSGNCCFFRTLLVLVC